MTLYDYLLMFDDEVWGENLGVWISVNLLLYPLWGFVMSGKAGRLGVCSVARTDRTERWRTDCRAVFYLYIAVRCPAYF